MKNDPQEIIEHLIAEHGSSEAALGAAVESSADAQKKEDHMLVNEAVGRLRKKHQPMVDQYTNKKGLEADDTTDEFVGIAEGDLSEELEGMCERQQNL